MSLDKSIEHGKEHRRQYYRSERFDKTCRCHGGCPWCLGNRQHRNSVKSLDADEQTQDIPFKNRNRNLAKKKI